MENFKIEELKNDKEFIRDLKEIGESAKYCCYAWMHHNIDDKTIDELIMNSDFYKNNYEEDEDDEDINNHEELHTFMYSFIIDYLFDNYDVVKEYNKHKEKYFYVKMIKEYYINGTTFENSTIEFCDWENSYIYNEDYIYYAFKNKFSDWNFKKLSEIYGEGADYVKEFTIEEFKYCNDIEYKSSVIKVYDNDIKFFYDERR